MKNEDENDSESKRNPWYYSRELLDILLQTTTVVFFNVPIDKEPR